MKLMRCLYQGENIDFMIAKCKHDFTPLAGRTNRLFQRKFWILWLKNRMTFLLRLTALNYNRTIFERSSKRSAH